MPAKRKTKSAPPAATKLVHLGGYFPEPFRRGMWQVKGRSGKDVQELFALMMNKLFAEHGLPQIKYTPPPKGRPSADK